jgi:putative phage-type endonuclease
MSPRILGSACLLGNYEAGSPDWFAAREGRLGASEIAAVLGLSKWQSPFSLWHLKSGNIAPEADNREMEWGRDLEALIARRFARNHPEWRLSRCGLYANRERSWQVAQPDRVIHYGQRRLAALEVKTDRNAEEWGVQGTDEIPIYYLCQARWQLDTFGWDRCHVAVLIAGSDYREYLVEHDHADAKLMRDEALRFLAIVADGVPPDIDSHEVTYRAVRELHPDIDGTEVEVDPELAAAYEAACTGLTEAEDLKRLTTSRLADVMGNARRAICNEKRVAVRVPGKNGSPPHLRPARTATKREVAA